MVAFRLDREPLRPLWALPLQQFVYRQLMYLVLIQSAITALTGGRLRWQKLAPRPEMLPWPQRVVPEPGWVPGQVAISGDLLGDRYRLDDRIAGGGMGDVWLGTDTVLGRRVAVKMLHARQAGDALFQTRFLHEARSMAALHHPGVAQVYDYGETGDDDGAYLVMAHVDGQPLDERIAAAGRLDPAETVSIVAQAARALHAAHTAGIIHRDVKPGNLIVQPDGTVVLVDFGVARSPESVDLTGVGEVVGTALYIAPSRCPNNPSGRRPTSTRSAPSRTSAWPDARRSSVTTRSPWRCITSATIRRRCPPIYRRRCATSSPQPWRRTRPTGFRRPRPWRTPPTRSRIRPPPVRTLSGRLPSEGPL